MKNKILLSIVALFIFVNTNAQLAITAATTCASTTLNATVTGMTVTSTGLISDDNWSGAIPIGFTFNFYGIPYTQCLIGSNGEIGFNLSSATGYEPWNIYATLLAGAVGNGNRISGFWADLYLPAFGTIFYGTSGTAPNRKFIVDFCNVALYTCTTTHINSEIIIYETSNLVEVHVGSLVACPAWDTGYAIIGVVDSTATNATTAPGRDHPSVWNATDEAWRFTPVGTTSYSVASIPYATVPFTTATIYWYDSTTGAYLGTGSPYTVFPAVGTTYKAAAVSCADTLFSYIHVVPSSVITGTNTVCVGSNITLSDTTSGGVWSSAFPAIATVTGSGVVHGVIAGIDTIYYTVGTCRAFMVITVNPIPTAGVITGLSSVCVGAAITLTDVTTGGVWSTSNASFAVVASGVVTGVGAGIDTIKYSVTNACGTAVAIHLVTVNPLPTVTPITGLSSVCAGANITLTDATVGGLWMSSNANATVTGTGVVHGVAGGTDTISYSVTNSCGVVVAVKVITINAAPSAGVISGATTVCPGSTITLTDAVSGGLWSVSNANATIAGGVVTGVSAGADTVSYSVSNACGTSVATYIITVNSGPAAITPVSAINICLSTTVTLSDALPGGIWSSSMPATASVSATGVVTGNAIGVATISYSIGSCFVTKLVTVISGPAAISPVAATVCQGMNITFTDATGGGLWTSSAVGIATVVGGVVTGVSPGTAIISYSIGTCTSTANVTVNASPAAITPPAAISLCIGNVSTLADITPGGVWSSSSAAATVTGTGVVTAVFAGVATISYTVGGCPATKIITVSSSPAAILPAAPVVCVGSILFLSDGVGGGVWSSSAPGTATVSVTGMVTGIATGSATITYAIGTCQTSIIVTVNPLPVTGAISGPTSICGVAAITLTDAISGGVWSASNGKATISATGVVTGVSGGTDTISYSVTNSCGTAAATYIITIVATPTVVGINGPAVICAGSFAIYTDSSAGGVWSISNANATIGGTGIATGITAGTDTIIYTITNACGTASTTKPINISALPFVAPVTGPNNVCIGGMITLNDATGGGIWSRTNTKATVSGIGVVTGVTTGIDTIIYSVTNSCGTVRDSMVVNILTIPVPGAITGSDYVCVGSIGTYTDAIGGGFWSISNAHASIVTILGNGLVSGITLGLDTIIYSVTNICGSANISKPITVNPFPVAGVISGPITVCQASTITLSETIPGGVWSSNNTAVATISGIGVVTGITAGTDTISYDIANSCGTVGTWTIISVSPLPNPGTITGPTEVCTGGAIALTDAIAGGIWSSSNTHATVTVTGIVTGVTSGTDFISYAVTNMCGTAIATSLITIDTLPIAGSISWTDGVCVGSAVTLIDTVPGGIWIASNATAMIIGPGIIFGVTPGIDTIFYTVTNICGTTDAIKILPVNPLPVISPIAGPSEICIGTITNLTDDTTGGSWFSSNPAVATIDITTGLIHGLTAGTTTITYTVTNVLGCPASVTYSVSVAIVPVIPAITGISHECIGTSSLLSNSTIGGVWSSSNIAIATVDVTGNVTGITAGVATITYTVTNICGTSNVTKQDTVHGLPFVTAILGTAIECVGATTVLTDATTGGVWSSNDTTLATVNAATGVVTGVSAGTVVINYTVSNIFGCITTVSITNTVNPLPAIAPITGITNECLEGVQILSDITPGGAWSSSNPLIASVNAATGLVTGITGGIVNITYSVSNLFGCTGIVTTPDTVNTMPLPSAITGTMHVCVGATATLGDATLWGVWTSVTPTVATVAPGTGVITGVSEGTDIILYNVSNPCGSVIDSAIITVYAAPVVSPIIGSAITICAGASTIVSDATTGGTWSSSNTLIATVIPTTGVVTGVAAGAAIITYTVVNTNGCAGYATYNINFGSYLGTSYILPASATLCGVGSVHLHVVTSSGGLTYQWMKNGILIPGATNFSYNADSVGNYSVVLSNGVCEETLTGTTVTNAPTPIINFLAPNMLYTGSYASYQWYKNGIAIPGATTSMYFETTPGDYTVAVTDANGCTVTTPVYTVHSGIGSGVGIVINKDDIRIYPNPATSVLYIDAPQEISLKILCVDGRKVIEQSATHEVNISSLADGMYIIMIYDSNDLLIKTDRFIKRN